MTLLLLKRSFFLFKTSTRWYRLIEGPCLYISVVILAKARIRRGFQTRAFFSAKARSFAYAQEEVIVMLESEQYKQTESVVLAGPEVCILPQQKLQEYAEQMSANLKQNPNSMIQYSPEQLLLAMLNGLAVVAYDLETSTLDGFAQLWEYDSVSFELGSWFSNKKGTGKKVLNAGIELNQKLHPDKKTIAIVAMHNRVPQMCIENLGGKQIGIKTSDKVFNHNTLQPTQMKIYDL